MSHLVVEGEEERVILPFVGLCISDDLPDIPVEALGGKELRAQLLFNISCCKKLNTAVSLMTACPHSQMNVP